MTDRKGTTVESRWRHSETTVAVTTTSAMTTTAAGSKPAPAVRVTTSPTALTNAPCSRAVPTTRSMLPPDRRQHRDRDGRSTDAHQRRAHLGKRPEPEKRKARHPRVGERGAAARTRPRPDDDDADRSEERRDDEVGGSPREYLD